MTKARHPIQDKLIVALGLALDEIHNPGAARLARLDIDAICRGVLKEATSTKGLPLMIRKEIERRMSDPAAA